MQAAASVLNVFGWLLSLTLLFFAWRGGRITHLKAFGVSVSLAQQAVVAASRASRVREARDQQIRHPGQRSSSPVVDVEALRAIVDRAFVPTVAERLVGKAVLWVDDNPRNNVYEASGYLRYETGNSPYREAIGLPVSYISIPAGMKTR